MSCEEQALVPTERCLKHECYQMHYSSLEGSPRWHGPKLVKRGQLWRCPNCDASYGEHAKEDLREATT